MVWMIGVDVKMTAGRGELSLCTDLRVPRQEPTVIYSVT
jgi:hypothetical protein